MWQPEFRVVCHDQGIAEKEKERVERVYAFESFVEAEIFVSSTPLLPLLSPRNQRENVRKL